MRRLPVRCWPATSVALLLLLTRTASCGFVLVHYNGNCLNGVVLASQVSLDACATLTGEDGRSYFQYPVNEQDNGLCTGCPDDPASFQTSSALSGFFSIYRSVLPPAPPPRPP